MLLCGFKESCFDNSKQNYGHCSNLCDFLSEKKTEEGNVGICTKWNTERVIDKIYTTKEEYDELKKEIFFSCGMCGTPCNIWHDQIPEIPENYNPDNYDHDWCNNCAQEELAMQEDNYVQVTREMSLDAQDPSLEGQWIKW